VLLLVEQGTMLVIAQDVGLDKLGDAGVLAMCGMVGKVATFMVCC
jgi:hypothetical protein